MNLRAASALVLQLTHVAAQLALLLFSAWFIAACAFAGQAGVLAGFNYVVPATLIRLLAFTRIGSGYFEKYFGHLQLLQSLQSVRAQLLTAVFYQQVAVQQSTTAHTLQQSSETQAAHWTAVSSPLFSAASVVVALSFFVSFALPDIEFIWYGLLVCVALTLVIAQRLHRQQLAAELLLQQAFLACQQRWLHTVTLWHFSEQNSQQLNAQAIQAAKARQRSQFIELLCESLMVLYSMAAITLMFLTMSVIENPIIWVVAFFLLLAIRDWSTPLLSALWAANREAVFAAQVLPKNPTAVSELQKPSESLGIEFSSIQFAGFSWQRGQKQGPQYSSRWPKQGLVWLKGPSGVGKSSLLQAMLGELEYSGNCYLNGRSLAQFTKAERSQYFHYQQQDAHIFSDTLAHNLMLGQTKLADEQLFQALRWSGLDDWANNEQLGLWLGEQGRPISGGECQRLKLARAYLSAAPILLLDEPFEGLDADMQNQISMNLTDLAQNKLIVIVSHIAPQELSFDLATSLNA